MFIDESVDVYVHMRRDRVRSVEEEKWLKDRWR